MQFHDALDYAIGKLDKNNVILKEQQYEALKSVVVENRDIFFSYLLDMGNH
jgi:dsDNA-binding SOS-regulon protein